MITRQTIVVVCDVDPHLRFRANQLLLVQMLEWLRAQRYCVVLVIQAKQLSTELWERLAPVVDELHVASEAEPIPQQGLTSLMTSAVIFGYRRLKGVRKRLRNVLDQTLADRATMILPEEWLALDRYCSLRTIQTVRMIVRQRSPVAVIVEDTRLSRCFLGLPYHVLRVTRTQATLTRLNTLHNHNAEDAQAQVALESRALLRGHAVVVGHEQAAKLVKMLSPEREILVVGYAPPYQPGVTETQPEQPAVLLHGDSTQAMRDSLLLFIEYIWPRVLARVNGAKLLVLGPVGEVLPPYTPAAEVLQEDRCNREQAYAMTSVVVNPVTSGDGISVDTLDAIAAGKAVVTTRAGAMGLPSSRDAVCFVAHDWLEFGDHLINLLQNQALREQISARAARFATGHLSVNTVFGAFGERLKAQCAFAEEREAAMDLIV